MTKKAAVKTTGVLIKPADKSEPAKKFAPEKAAKMTKTQLIKTMSGKLDAQPKQVQSFFDLLVETATEQTGEAGEFTIPVLASLSKQKATSVWDGPGNWRGDYDRGENNGEVPFREACHSRHRTTKGIDKVRTQVRPTLTAFFGMTYTDHPQVRCPPSGNDLKALIPVEAFISFMRTSSDPSLAHKSRHASAAPPK